MISSSNTLDNDKEYFDSLHRKRTNQIVLESFKIQVQHVYYLKN